MKGKKNQLFFCTECYHVYFGLPPGNQCVICHNEVLEQDLISNLDILTCETCHSLYTLQKQEEIISHQDNNINHLCSCQHQCPTNSVLSIGKQEAFIGNIVKADIFKCTNCGAISFRNLENSQKTCSECNSRFVSPLHWDPETQKTFYRCANPDHKIRLKLRDLILNNNEIIRKEINKIKQKELDLQNEYKRLRQQIQTKYENMGLLKKIKSLQKGKQAYENEQAQLNVWAKRERVKLYSYLRPIGLRCSVYRMDKSENGLSFERTSDGCGAIAHLRIRKIVIAPDGTVIEREPSVKQEPIENRDQQIQNPTAPINAVEVKINHPISKWTNSDEISLVNDSNESIFTQILRNQPNSEILEEEAEEDKMTEDFIQIAYESLPPIAENQLYIFFMIKFKKPDSEIYKINTYGVIPLEFTSNDSTFQLGREHLLKAYWQEHSILDKNPFIFNNITESTNNSYQFGITKKQKELFIDPGRNGLSKNLITTIENQNLELTEQYPIHHLIHLTINGKYAYGTDHDKNFSDLQFVFSFKPGGMNE